MSANYDISTINNDTFNGVQFTVNVNNSILDLTDYNIRLQVRKHYQSSPVISLSVGSGITITDAHAGKFQIEPQIFTAIPFVYLYDIEFDAPDETVKTYISGNFEVLADITQ